MKISLSISLILFLLPLETFCQTLNDQSIAYLTLENETEKCMDNWLDTNQVGWEELSHVFERYFIDAGITDSSDSIAKQYLDILSFWNHPSKSFPAFKQREVIRNAQKKLNLSDENLKSYSQLSCLLENYRQNKSKLDPASSFHVFGEP